MNDVLRMINRAAEQTLENERLTAGLKDQSAAVLNEWAMDCIKQIARSAFNEKSNNETRIQEKIQALHKFMRLIGNWVTNRTGWKDSVRNNSLSQLISLAKIIYADQYIPPNRIQKIIFLRLDSKSTSNEMQTIVDLRRFLEAQMKYHKNMESK